MSAAYLDSSHDNTIPMKQSLNITLVLTQQESREHKLSISPSFHTHNSSALWGCMTLFGPPQCILVAGAWWRWGFWVTSYLFCGSASVWRNCSCLTKRPNVICTGDILRSKQSRWKIIKGNTTTFFLSPCPAHTAVHNTHPSHGEWLYYSATLYIKDVAVLSLNLYRLAHLDLHGVTISFYLNFFQYFWKWDFKCQELPPRNLFHGKKDIFLNVKTNKKYTFAFSSFDFFH